MTDEWRDQGQVEETGADGIGAIKVGRKESNGELLEFVPAGNGENAGRGLYHLWISMKIDEQ